MNHMQLTSYEQALMRLALQAADSVIAAMPNKLEISVTHHFCNGIYIRECFIPAGTVLTGRIHKHSHFCLLLIGDVEMASQDGNGRYQGPYLFKSSAGCKRLLRSFSDTVFLTLHPTDKTSIEELENDLAVDTYDQYDQFKLTKTNFEVLP